MFPAVQNMLPYLYKVGDKNIIYPNIYLKINKHWENMEKCIQQTRITYKICSCYQSIFLFR